MQKSSSVQSRYSNNAATLLEQSAMPKVVRHVKITMYRVQLYNKSPCREFSYKKSHPEATLQVTLQNSAKLKVTLQIESSATNKSFCRVSKPLQVTLQFS